MIFNWSEEGKCYFSGGRERLNIIIMRDSEKKIISLHKEEVKSKNAKNPLLA